jgi:hypothetical protein
VQAGKEAPEASISRLENIYSSLLPLEASDNRKYAPFVTIRASFGRTVSGVISL